MSAILRSPIQIKGYSIRNKPIIVKPVQAPIVFKESLACLTAPVFTSLEISSILRVASKPGNGSGSSTSQTLRNMIKYITPRKPANMLATMPTKARRKASPSSRVIKGPLANSYFAFVARRKIAGNVKMKPVHA